MSQRHKSIPFQNPINPDLDLELDPEKELWVPGKKKYFLPGGSTKTIQLIEWDIPQHIKDVLECDECLKQEQQRRNLYLGNWDLSLADAMVCDCLPGENRFRGNRAEVEVPVRDARGTWAGPFRSFRIPLEIRGGRRGGERVLSNYRDRRLID